MEGLPVAVTLTVGEAVSRSLSSAGRVPLKELGETDEMELVLDCRRSMGLLALGLPVPGGRPRRLGAGAPTSEESDALRLLLLGW